MILLKWDIHIPVGGPLHGGGHSSWVENDAGKVSLRDAALLRDHLRDDIRACGASESEIADDFRRELGRFSDIVFTKCEMLNQRMIEAKELDRLGVAYKLQSQISDYLDQMLVSQLSEQALIPTYSFPTSSVRLEIVQDKDVKGKHVDHDADLQLTRDAAIGIVE